MKITRKQIRRILSEALTQTDKNEIERIARKEAQSEIEKVVGRDLSKTIKEEVSKALKDKATKQARVHSICSSNFRGRGLN